MMNKKKISAIALISVLAIGTIIWGRSGHLLSFAAQKETTPQASDKSISVRVLTAKTELRTASTSYKATLEPAQEGIVSAQRSGKVVQINFENGKHASQGEVLIRLDDRDAKIQIQVSEAQLALAKATLQKAQTGLNTIQLSYNRTAALFQQGAVSQSELDAITSSLKIGQADVQSAEAGVQSYSASVDAQKTALDNTIIRAPISGIMDSKNVNLGQQVTPEIQLGKIKDVSSVDASIEIDQANITTVQLGQKAQVRLSETSDTYFDGLVNSIDPSADPSSRVFKAKVRVSNASGSLHPGVFSWVRLESVNPVPTLTLPVEVVTGKDGAYFVFVNEKGIAHRHLVLVGDVYNNRVEIKSGIPVGAQVITTNLNTIQDGDSVKVTAE